MEEVFLVHVSQALQSLKKYVSDDVLGKELAPVLHDFKYILVEVFKDKV